MHVQREDGLEPVEGLLRVLLLVDDVQEVLHEVVGLVGDGDVLLVLPHELDQVLSHHLPHLSNQHRTSSFSRC